MIFKERSIQAEALDHAAPEVARPNLADLVRINRRFGGYSTLLKTFAKAAPPPEPFTVLDVGAASGDSAAVLQRVYPMARVTSLDLHWTNLEAAPFPKLIADAFAPPFAGLSFDYVACSLFLHHFEDEGVEQLLRAFYALAKRAVIVCDLERSVLPYLFLPATRTLFGWNEITVADGMKSVRAAFRKQELVALARRAGMQTVEAQVFRPAFRIGLVGRRDVNPVGTRR